MRLHICSEEFMAAYLQLLLQLSNMFNLFSHDEAGKHFDKLMETPHHEKLPYEGAALAIIRPRSH